MVLHKSAVRLCPVRLIHFWTQPSEVYCSVGKVQRKEIEPHKLLSKEKVGTWLFYLEGGPQVRGGTGAWGPGGMGHTFPDGTPHPF